MQQSVRTHTLRLELCGGGIPQRATSMCTGPQACVTHCLLLSHYCLLLVTPHQQLQASVCCLFGDVFIMSSDSANVSLDLTRSFSFLFTHTLCASVTILVIIHCPCPHVYNVVYCYSYKLYMYCIWEVW